MKRSAGDGRRAGRWWKRWPNWRSGMSPQRLKERGYGRRWMATSWFGGLKRTLGAALFSKGKVSLVTSFLREPNS